MPDNGDEQPSSSRRRLLSGLATACGAAVAGCTTLPAFGQQVRFGSVDRPETGPPDYRDWIPTRDRSDQFDGFRTSVEYLEPGTRGRDLLGTPYGGTGVKPGMDHVGVDLSGFEWAAEARGSVVAKGTVETETVETALDGTGYDRYGSYGGYTVYERDDLQRVLAHGDEYVLFSGYIDEPMQFIEPIIDAGSGRQIRLHEAESRFEALTDSVRAPPWVRVRPGSVTVDGSEAVMEARSVDFGDSTVYPGRAFVFEESADVSEQDVRDSISEYPEALEANRVEVTVDGPVATAVAKLPPETFRELDNVALYDQPIITWGLAWEPGDSTAVLTHEAGDPVDAETLRVYLKDIAGTANDGTDGPQPPDPADEQFSDSHDRIDPGDSLTLDVADLEKWQLRVSGEPTGTAYRWNELSYLPPSFVDQ